MTEEIFFLVMCIICVIFSLAMIVIWICIGLSGGPIVGFQPPRAPVVPPLPPVSKE